MTSPVEYPPCITDGCGNRSRTIKPGLCETHYGRTRICVVPGCESRGRYRGQVCGTHTTRTKVCDTDGCTTMVRGPRSPLCDRCYRQRRLCRADGCTTRGSQRGQWCRLHLPSPIVRKAVRDLPNAPCPLGCGRPWHNLPAPAFPRLSFLACAGSQVPLERTTA